MPARRFTKDSVRWKPCEYCGNRFPDSRKDRRFCKKTCQDLARRARNRLGAIAAQGGKCKDCGKRFDPDYPSAFFVLKDKTVVCGADLSRRAREKFHKRWPKGKTGYRKSKSPTS